MAAVVLSATLVQSFTSDVERLSAAFAAGALLSPSSDAPSIVDLSRALASLAGADIQPTPGSQALAERIGPSEHLVFVLVDGLGMELVERMPQTSFMARHLAGELRTVFPSTTAVALTSFATGEWPGRHGVTGWWTHLLEIGAAASLLQFVTRSTKHPLTRLGLTPEQLLPAPPLMSMVKRDALALMPELIADSAYSIYFSGGKARRGYRSLHEAVDTTLKRIEAARGPTYTYLYTNRIDNSAHAYGIGHREVQAALAELELEIERLRCELDGHGRIVLSADHGFLDAPEGVRHQITSWDGLRASLDSPPSGDSRVLYFHVRDASHLRVRQYFRRRFGERFLLLTIEDAERLQLFGPHPASPLTRSRMGDLLAISMGADVIEYRPPGGNSKVMMELSHHSGLTAAEMRVPLIIA